MKGINRIIDMLVTSGRSGDISLDSDGLLECLAKSEHNPKHWWEIPYQKGLRLILVLGAAVMMLTVILYYGIRYINDVILYENQLTINEQGAFNPRKSLNCEYALYLFNTADLWANSGIQVNEKDRIRINISGAYNSSVEGSVLAARENTEQRYPWLSYDTVPKNQDTTKEGKIARDLCIARGDDRFDFGSPMYAIFPESGDLRSNPMKLSLKLSPQLDSLRQRDKKQKIDSLWHNNISLWKKEESRTFRRAGKTGTLYFAVNDMYFNNDEEMKSYYTIANDFHDKPFSEREINTRLDRPKHDYEDNLGQLLVSVEIQRHVPCYIFYPTMAYRFFEYNVNETLDHNTWGSVGKWILCACYFFIFLVWVSVLFGLYMIALLVIIYLIFLAGHWIPLFFKRGFKCLFKCIKYIFVK